MFQNALGLGVLASLLGQGVALPTGVADKPNIIFILTDDQDTRMNSVDYMPLLQKYMVDEGTTYPNHYCTVALCCPARTTIWTGMNAHNTNVTDLAMPWGGWRKFVNQGLNDDYLPIWLSDAGYQTYYVGKWLNSYNMENYNDPVCTKGWTGSEFLIDPYTYSFWNTVSTRNCGPPLLHNGTYNTDLVANSSFGFLDEAVQSDSPFFLAIAPMAPHNQIEAGVTGPPVSAPKFEHMFQDEIVPRTDNFNPEVPSGASWVRTLPRLNGSMVAENDEWFRLRLRSLQSIDELVENLFLKLESYSLLENTYIFYSSDNGFHISQHRFSRGKTCPYEEDTNVPLIIRGPGIAKGAVSSAVTAHVDLAPTFLELAGLEQRDTIDGAPIALTDDKPKLEHANIEFWGLRAAEWDPVGEVNNTYKSVRLVGEDYSFYYTVWCTGEHELYDMATDPGQMTNLWTNGFDDPATETSTSIGVTDYQLALRLDSLLFVMKSCAGDSCRRPWEQLLPGEGLTTLKDALATEYDAFFKDEVPRIAYTSCEAGYLLWAEGPQLQDWVGSDSFEVRAGDPDWALWT